MAKLDPNTRTEAHELALEIIQYYEEVGCDCKSCMYKAVDAIITFAENFAKQGYGVCTGCGKPTIPLFENGKVFERGSRWQE